MTSLPESFLTKGEEIERAIASFGEDYRSLVFCRFREAKGLQDAVADKAPTFHDVTNFFSKQATLFWLRFHIAETFAFLGIYDTATKMQVRETADLILGHEIYGQFSLAEFLCFLKRFKAGDYGKIYQSARPNPQEFLMCLKAFWQDLSAERGRQWERDRQEREAEERKKPRITWEEYCKINGMEGRPSPLDRLSNLS